MTHMRYLIRPCAHSVGIRVYPISNNAIDFLAVNQLLSQQSEFSYHIISDAMIVLEPNNYNENLPRLRIILLKDGTMIFRGISTPKDVDEWLSKIENLCGI